MIQLLFTVYVKDTLTGKRSKHIMERKSESLAKQHALKRERKLRGLNRDYNFLIVDSIYSTIMEDKTDDAYPESKWYRNIDNRYK